jgi:predicted DCC family thiol-disulfide oxidoreductase YuxK
MDITNQPVLYFDGVCNLCNNAVQFIIRHDKKKMFLFASLQSAAGKQALQHFRGKAPDSLILHYKGQYFTKSAAVLYTFKLLGGFWALFYAAIIIPRFLRDSLYGLVADKRYKWFGKQNECMIPTPELMNRFLS